MPRSSSVSGWSRSTVDRLISGALTSKNGFSVVAPMSVTTPASTAGEQGVLLALVEPVDLVEEQDRAAALVLLAAPGGVDDRPDVAHAGVDGRERHELPVGVGGDHAGEGGLAGARRPPQDDRRQPVGLDQRPQRRPRAEQVGLADDLVERAGAHAGGEGRLAAEALADRVLGQVLLGGAARTSPPRALACRHERQVTGGRRGGPSGGAAPRRSLRSRGRAARRRGRVAGPSGGRNLAVTGGSQGRNRAALDFRCMRNGRSDSGPRAPASPGRYLPACGADTAAGAAAVPVRVPTPRDGRRTRH